MAASGKCQGCGKNYYLDPNGKVPWHENNGQTCSGVGKNPA